MSEYFSLGEAEKKLLQRNEELERQRKKVVQEAEKLMTAQEKLFEETTAETLFQTNSSFDAELDEDEDLTTESSCFTEITDKIDSSSKKGTRRKKPAVADETDDDEKDSFGAEPTLADIELEAKVLGAEHLSSSSASRFYKAKCIRMDEDIKLMAQKCADSVKKNTFLFFLTAVCEYFLAAVDFFLFFFLLQTSESIDIKNENSKLKNESKILKKKFEKSQMIQNKFKSKFKDSTNECKILKAQVDTLQRQMRLDKKQNRQKRNETNTHEVKLNRALSEVKKYKDLAMKYQNQNKDYLNTNHQKNGKLQGEVQKLKRQKNQLMNAYKKQMKLIDVLKRQKLHLEAVKLVSFTEQEFLRTLELGEKLETNI